MKAGKFIRILCEGEITEPNYFRGIIKANRISSARVMKPKDNSPFGIVKAAKEEVKKARKAKIPNKEIKVWAVFDMDGHPNIENAFTMAHDNNINIAFSSTCFEFWILLHYDKINKPFGPCDDIIKYIKNKYDQDYLKKNDHYAQLASKIPIAIENNEWLLEKHWKYELEKGIEPFKLNPYTDVFELVKFLLRNKNDIRR